MRYGVLLAVSLSLFACSAGLGDVIVSDLVRERLQYQRELLDRAIADLEALHCQDFGPQYIRASLDRALVRLATHRRQRAGWTGFAGGFRSRTAAQRVGSFTSDLQENNAIAVFGSNPFTGAQLSLGGGTMNTGTSHVLLSDRLTLGSTFHMQEGRLIGAHRSNPFGTTALQLSGGGLLLSVEAGATVTFNRPLTVDSGAVIAAGDYLGKGVWFGDDWGCTVSSVCSGELRVVDDCYVEDVDLAVFQALEGDTDVNGDVSFADFNEIATNYTGTGQYYHAKGGDAGRDDAMLEGTAAELIVNLGDGSVVMTGGPVALNGYSVTSASGSLLPDDFPMPLPLQFYLSNSLDEITAGVLGTQVVLDGSLAMSWGVDVGGLKGEPDLVFNYGTSAGVFQGNVVYVVPEPSTMAILAAGLLALCLLQGIRAVRS